jgi:integrase
MTPRPRKHNRHLPQCVYLRHGAYYLVRGGKWTRLGTTLADALAAYAVTQEGGTGMPALIDAAMPTITHGRAAATARQYRKAAKELRGVFSEFDPLQVTPRHVAQMMASMRDRPMWGNQCLTVLRLVLDYGLTVGACDSNVAAGIKPHKQTKRGRIITPAELRAIYAAADDRLRIIIDLLVRTGQRVSDVLGIRRADLTDEGIAFRQQKTGARVTVPWTPELRAVVDRARRAQGDVLSMTLLRARGGRKPGYAVIRKDWVAACKVAKVADANLHDLRALAAMRAKAQGLNPTALLGHTTPAQTARYLRELESVLAEGPSFGAELDGALDSIGQPPPKPLARKGKKVRSQ